MSWRPSFPIQNRSWIASSLLSVLRKGGFTTPILNTPILLFVFVLQRTH